KSISDAVQSAPVVMFRTYGESRFLSAIQGVSASQRWEVVPTAAQVSLARQSEQPMVASLSASSSGTNCEEGRGERGRTRTTRRARDPRPPPDLEPNSARGRLRAVVPPQCGDQAGRRLVQSLRAFDVGVPGALERSAILPPGPPAEDLVEHRRVALLAALV